jgi:hypothetical protein
MPMTIFSLLCPYIPISSTLSGLIRRLLKQHTTIVFMEPPASVGKTPEVILLIPHGLICVENMSMFIKWSAEIQNMNSTLFVDRQLWLWTPLNIMIMNLTGQSHGISKHTHIDRHMQSTKKHVVAFPGGFAEAVGGTEKEQILSLGTISYWLKQCKRHGYSLRVFHTYNGSDMVLQSSVCLRLRVQLARRFHVPLPLPIRFQTPPARVVRCLFYDNENLPVTSDTVKDDLFRYVEVDKKSPLFPTPLRKYTSM